MAFVPAASADRVLEAMRSHPAAAGAARIGMVTAVAHAARSSFAAVSAADGS